MNLCQLDTLAYNFAEFVRARTRAQIFEIKVNIINNPHCDEDFHSKTDHYIPMYLEVNLQN